MKIIRDTCTKVNASLQITSNVYAATAATRERGGCISQSASRPYTGVKRHDGSVMKES